MFKLAKEWHSDMGKCSMIQASAHPSTQHKKPEILKIEDAIIIDHS